MKRFLSVLAAVVLILTVVYFCGPRPDQPTYNSKLPEVPEISKLAEYVALQESKFKVKPGNEAEIVWGDSSRQQTEYAVVYLHGFSASKEEGNPTHLYLAKALHANLYLARLSDHGLDTISPMQYLTADKLWNSAKEAFAIGKKLGKKVILIGTSTGGTLALQLAATFPEVNSLVLMSPNIKINDPNAWLVNDPWGLQIARLVTGGNERVLEGKTPLYEKFWYVHYRLESVIQLQEMLETTMTRELFGRVKQPLLMLYYYKNEAEQDPVVRVDAMLEMFDQLGTPANKKEKIAIPSAGNHVLGSIITSKDIGSVKRAMDGFIKVRLAE